MTNAISSRGLSCFVIKGDERKHTYYAIVPSITKLAFWIRLGYIDDGHALPSTKPVITGVVERVG